MLSEKKRVMEVLFKQGMSVEDGREVLSELGFHNPTSRPFRGCITFMTVFQ